MNSPQCFLFLEVNPKVHTVNLQSSFHLRKDKLDNVRIQDKPFKIEKNSKTIIDILRKDKDQGVKRSFMNMKVEDRKESKSTQRKVLTNQSQLMINPTKTPERTHNLLLLKMRKR